MAKVYEIYAAFPEACYLICTTTDPNWSMNSAEAECLKLGQWPHAFFAAEKGVHKINAELRSLDDLRKR